MFESDQLSPIITIGESMGVIWSPEHDTQQSASIDTRGWLSFSGAESNFAIALARQNMPAIWLSAVSNDPFGDRIIRKMREAGVDVTQALICENTRTPILLKSLQNQHPPKPFYQPESTAFSLHPQYIKDTLKDLPATLLYLTSSLLHISPLWRNTAIEIWKSSALRSVPVWFELNHLTPLHSQEPASSLLKFLTSSFQYFHTLFCSWSDAQEFTQLPDPQAVLHSWLHSKNFSPPQQVILKFPEGAILSTPTQSWTAGKINIETTSAAPSPAKSAAFNAAFLQSLLLQKSPLDCLEAALHAQSLTDPNLGDWEGIPTLEPPQKTASF